MEALVDERSGSKWSAVCMSKFNAKIPGAGEITNAPSGPHKSFLLCMRKTEYVHLFQPVQDTKHKLSPSHVLAHLVRAGI